MNSTNHGKGNFSREPIDVVAAVIARGSGSQVEVMLFQRLAGHSGGGCWEFPGGKIEVNESESQALVREIIEELSIEVFVQDKLSENSHRYPQVTVNLKAYYCVPRELNFEAQIKLSDHQEFLWANKDQLMKLPLSPADIPMIEEIFTKLAARKS